MCPSALCEMESIFWINNSPLHSSAAGFKVKSNVIKEDNGEL